MTQADLDQFHKYGSAAWDEAPLWLVWEIPAREGDPDDHIRPRDGWENQQLDGIVLKRITKEGVLIEGVETTRFQEIGTLDLLGFLIGKDKLVAADQHRSRFTAEATHHKQAAEWRVRAENLKWRTNVRYTPAGYVPLATFEVMKRTGMTTSLREGARDWSFKL